MQLVGLDLRVHDADGPFTRLVVEGELDSCTSPLFREKVLGLCAAGKVDLVVDLDGVTFVDSSGLGVLVGALKHVRQAGGDLHLARVPRRVWKLLGITDLVSVFSFVDPVDLAATG